MLVVTSGFLVSEDACGSSIETFTKEWPEGVVLSSEAMLRAVEIGLDLDWFAGAALNPTAYSVYSGRVAEDNRSRDRMVKPFKEQERSEVKRINTEYETRHDDMVATFKATIEERQEPLIRGVILALDVYLAEIKNLRTVTEQGNRDDVTGYDAWLGLQHSIANAIGVHIEPVLKATEDEKERLNKWYDADYSKTWQLPEAIRESIATEQMRARIPLLWKLVDWGNGLTPEVLRKLTPKAK